MMISVKIKYDQSVCPEKYSESELSVKTAWGGGGSGSKVSFMEYFFKPDMISTNQQLCVIESSSSALNIPTDFFTQNFLCEIDFHKPNS